MKPVLLWLYIFLAIVLLTNFSLYSAPTAQAAFPTYSAPVIDPTLGPGPAPLSDLEVVFARIIGFSTGLAILAFFIMFVIASFKYLTSGGEQKATESAKNTMTYAFIGLFVIVGAYIILALLESFTGIKLTIFSIPKT